MSAPEFWVVAGPNGAGKTTVVQKANIATLIRGVQFLNPDDHTLTRLRADGYAGFHDAPPDVQAADFRAAADEVFAELQAVLSGGGRVGVETVLSTDKYRSPVEQVRSAGGWVGLIYIAVSSPAISLARIAARVRRGGHDVPADRVAERWQRSLDHLPWFATRASAFWVFDNSASDDTHPLVATGRDGRLSAWSGTAFPELAAALNRIPEIESA